MDSRMADWKDRYETWAEESLDDWNAGKKMEVLENYPFMVFEDTPWTPFSGRASDHRFALITSGGLYLQGKQDPFGTESIHGDPSFREIPQEVTQKEIGIAHPFYDHRFVEEDINCIFPISHFIELEKQGIIGGLAKTHYSFTYVNNIIPLVEEAAPEVIKGLAHQGVDALFLVPV